MEGTSQNPEITSLNDNPFMGLSIEELDARLEMSATAGCWFVYNDCPKKTTDCALQRLCKFCCDKQLVAADANSVKSEGCCPDNCLAYCAAYCPSDCACAGGGYCAIDGCAAYCPTYVPPCPAECPTLCVAYSCPGECVVYQCTTIYQP